MEGKEKNSILFEEFKTKARAIQNEYDEKMKEIRKQRPIKGRGEYPEEMIFAKECDERIRQLAEEYHNK
ncbi:MAG TPA: hypothetical protein RWO66_02370 [Ruminococcus sp.]|uniref:Uncharacterized protein n=1 Tax=Siphoviridae sp. ctwhn18 TaxID=2825733 RepID=A0A8S5P0Z8_9CAUD|nr:MAG TPA: hypothetical protein [Siphoviridae sp. ctwhn18]